MLSTRSEFLLTFSAGLGNRITTIASFANMTVVTMLTTVVALTAVITTVMAPVATAPKSELSSCLGFSIFTVLNSKSVKAKLLSLALGCQGEASQPCTGFSLALGERSQGLVFWHPKVLPQLGIAVGHDAHMHKRMLRDLVSRYESTRNRG